MSLVPSCGEKFAYAVFCALHFVALFDDGVVGLDVVVDDVFDLVGVSLQPRAHVFGYVVGVEGAFVDVSEYGFYAVVA